MTKNLRMLRSQSLHKFHRRIPNPMDANNIQKINRYKKRGTQSVYNVRERGWQGVAGSGKLCRFTERK